MSDTPSLDWVYVPAHVAEGPSQVRHRDGWLVCEAPSDEYARLIAAAPRILEALKAAVAGWADHLEEGDAYPDWVDGARAAIVRAEGRS